MKRETAKNNNSFNHHHHLATGAAYSARERTHTHAHTPGQRRAHEAAGDGPRHRAQVGPHNAQRVGVEAFGQEERHKVVGGGWQG